ncbi:hypothetical protein ETC01_04330 [Geobacillus sp. NFOSA3]|nr:hypothetical protein [Geobacillus sp. NFOSA3]
MTFAFFYRASLGGPDERREQKFATLVGESFLNVTHKYFTHTLEPISKEEGEKIKNPIGLVGSSNIVEMLINSYYEKQNQK